MYSNGYEQATSRSPIAQRNQPQTGALHRMPSRQFDAYGQQMPQGNMYPQDDQQRGYEQPRNYERLNQTMHAGGYGYDMGASAGWNTNAFAQNGSLGSLGGAATARMKSQQQRGGGRSALPSVRSQCT
jgi:hypothetical protein